MISVFLIKFGGNLSGGGVGGGCEKWLWGGVGLSCLLYWYKAGIVEMCTMDYWIDGAVVGGVDVMRGRIAWWCGVGEREFGVWCIFVVVATAVIKMVLFDLVVDIKQ